MKNIIFISEYIDPPYDEGIKKTIFNIIQELSLLCKVKIISRNLGKSNPFLNISEKFDGNKLFLSRKLFRIISTHNPSLIIYAPFQSTTFASFIRAKILSLRFYRRTHLLIALQPKPLNGIERFLVKYLLKPESVFTPSPTLHTTLRNLAIKTSLFPLFTNLKDFYPLSKYSDKVSLRLKYNIPVDKIIVLHVGHLTINRNLDSLIPIQNDTVQVLIVDSSSTPLDVIKDNALRSKLVTCGILIINKYIPNIRDIYNLADIYIFPVIEKNSSIGLPLSVLEARACGLPVITTNFEGIYEFLRDDNGAIFYSLPNDFSITLKHVINKLQTTAFTNTYVAEINNSHCKIIESFTS